MVDISLRDLDLIVALSVGLALATDKSRTAGKGYRLDVKRVRGLFDWF